MKFLARITGVLCAVLLISTGSLSAQEALKVSIYTPPTHYITQFWQGVIEEMNTAAGGAVEVELYHSEALGKSTEQWEIVEEGLADMSVAVSAIFYPSRLTLSPIVELPFFNRNAMTSNKVIKRLVEEGLLAEEFPDVEFLTAYNTPPAQVFSAKPIEKASDFNGLRIVGQGPVWTQTWSLLGAQAVSMGWPDIYLALERGTVDAAPGNWAASKAWKWAEVADHPIEIGIMGGFFNAVVANKDSWGALPDEVKTKWLTILADVPLRIAGLADEAEEAGRQFARETTGHAIFEFPAGEKSKMAESLQPIWKDWFERNVAADKPAEKVYKTYVEVMEQQGEPVVMKLPVQ